MSIGIPLVCMLEDRESQRTQGFNAARVSDWGNVERACCHGHWYCLIAAVGQDTIIPATDNSGNCGCWQSKHLPTCGDIDCIRWALPREEASLGSKQGRRRHREGYWLVCRDTIFTAIGFPLHLSAWLANMEGLQQMRLPITDCHLQVVLAPTRIK